PRCTLYSHCDGAHRDLHSFPTRRSSDLRTDSPRRSARWSPRSATPKVTGKPPTYSAAIPSRGAASAIASRRVTSGGRRTSAAARSEEHTSELQSPDHLVCRLLLEKKKER